VTIRYRNCNVKEMFINEFFFSFSLLAFTALLFLLGALILVDGCRRLAGEWASNSARKKNRGVVLAVETAAPVRKGFRDGSQQFVKRTIAIPEEKAS